MLVASLRAVNRVNSKFQKLSESLCRTGLNDPHRRTDQPQLPRTQPVTGRIPGRRASYGRPDTASSVRMQKKAPTENHAASRNFPRQTRAPREPTCLENRFSGDDRARTGNLRLARAALSQLSYVPITNVRNSPQKTQERKHRGLQWVYVDSNHGPQPYQGCALTN